jgi:hypothetical protein
VSQPGQDAINYIFGASPTRCTYLLDLVLVQSRYPVDDHPRYAAAEIHNLVHEEAHDAGREHIVADERVPRRPEPFEVVELEVVFGDLVEFGPIGVRGVREHGVSDGAVHRAVAGWTRYQFLSIAY